MRTGRKREESETRGKERESEVHTELVKSVKGSFS
jgi:hypothetical protein